MPKKRSVSYVQFDGRRRFYLVLSVLGLMSVSFVAGLVVGQQNPRPINEHIEVGFQESPEAAETIAAPTPESLYTFYDELLDEDGEVHVPSPTHEDVVGEEVIAEDDPVRAIDREEPASAETAVGEELERDDDSVREIERAAVEPETQSPTALVNDEEDEDDAELAIARVELDDTSEDEAAALPARPVARGTARVGEDADNEEQGAADEPATTPRSVSRGGTTTAGGSTQYEVVVASSSSWDAADEHRRELRDAGLRATVIMVEEAGGEPEYRVVLRGQADDAEVRRQTALANRILGS